MKSFLDTVPSSHAPHSSSFVSRLVRADAGTTETIRVKRVVGEITDFNGCNNRWTFVVEDLVADCVEVDEKKPARRRPKRIRRELGAARIVVVTSAFDPDRDFDGFDAFEDERGTNPFVVREASSAPSTGACFARSLPTTRKSRRVTKRVGHVSVVPEVSFAKSVSFAVRDGFVFVPAEGSPLTLRSPEGGPASVAFALRPPRNRLLEDLTPSDVSTDDAATDSTDETSR